MEPTPNVPNALTELPPICYLEREENYGKLYF